MSLWWRIGRASHLMVAGWAQWLVHAHAVGLVDDACRCADASRFATESRGSAG